MAGRPLAQGRDALAYLLAKLGCTHPFRVSRLLALAEDAALERLGRRLTDLTYVPGPGVFYIEELKAIVESDECFGKREGDPQRRVRGCIYFQCETPKLPEEARLVIDEVIERYASLPDEELNRLALQSRVLRGSQG